MKVLRNSLNKFVRKKKILGFILGFIGCYCAVWTISDLSLIISSRKVSEQNFLKKNIWNVSETFLNTPTFRYDYMRNSWAEINKFDYFSSPQLASKEQIDLEIFLPNRYDDEFYYINGTTCSHFGSVYSDSQFASKCLCSGSMLDPEFSGFHCSVPESVATANIGSSFNIRNSSRRIIMGMVVNHELELLEIRIKQLHLVVDVFAILESNLTSGGDPKPLYIYNALSRGFLSEFHSKILYIFLDAIPEEAIKDGWMADDFLRNELSRRTLERVKNIQDDDLFLSFDADEIPNFEVLKFLRWHDGFSNPIEMHLRWTIFSFYWESFESESIQETVIPVGSTIGYLKGRCLNKIMDLRKKRCQGPEDQRSKSGPFHIGSFESPAGFHCSWCFEPEGIAIKLLSAIHQDFPRWGDDPSKTDISYLKNLTLTGSWFDGTHRTILRPFRNHKKFAPKFMLENRELYVKYLLQQNSN